ncbi:hypothetical protein K7432_018445 [Basidiobolus ranarum]|uniref:Uncharacterized protein n=1 Tax=Basidiobolus ranarum TaxID=34480 RepID=A0ABR2WC64_9FUNG
MTSILPGCTEPNFVVTPIHPTSSNETGLGPFLATKPEEAAMDSNSFVYYNSRGESIVDFTLELEIVRNCLGKIALQRRTFERRGSIDSINTNSSIVEDDSDIEDSAPMERRVLPTNVSFLLKELDGCLDNMKKCREHRNKKGNDKEPNNASKERIVERESEVKSRNLWISQENIAKRSLYCGIVGWLGV